MSIPKGWEEVRLGDICDKLGDGIHTTPKYDDNGEYFFINGNNLENGKIVFKEDTKRASEEEFIKHKRELNDRTILVSINGTLGNVATYNNEKCILGKSACYFNVSQGVSKEFIKQVVMHRDFQNYIRLSATGTTIPNVSLAVMRTYKFKLPPLKEQEKIAEILSSCDEHIKNLKNLKSELEKEKLHLMNELLSGKTRFSSFTTPWQEVTLADTCDIQKGQQLNKLNLQENGKFPVINGGIEPSGYYDEFNTQENTITISEGGNSCGYVNFLTTKFWSGGHCYTLQNVKIDNKFLYFYLKYQEKDIMKLRLGSGLPNIQKGSISAVIIKYPSLEEQKKIGEVLSACDERLECLNELITAQTTLKSHLLTELLSGNIRVNT
ncbi:type I restriction/modification system, specificity subunit [Campylobacter sp. RM5004]|uniref:restriction endonuclease subunit S n=1 Tax=Campylobacter sp. RM5004 TaxID=1660078 RepID=UPI001EFB24DF|nr:restriction endonuclease subunit S [Campylobacter sp. RM5004]ULO00737.1 type I restriction/modification system, specificity subunit [Campylobacter sp. RM5004]